MDPLTANQRWRDEQYRVSVVLLSELGHGEPPHMERNANGSYFCFDCWCVVILFDDDVHECDGKREGRGPGPGPGEEE